MAGIARITTLFTLGMMALTTAWAGTPPHLDAAGREAYQAFLGAGLHRAFAIAPGGRWGWSADADTPEMARQQALGYCQEGNEQRCVLHSVDKDTVFDATAWPGLWGPYADAASAARAPTGLKRGMRFPDLSLTDAKGRKLKLSDMRGSIVVLHFWGSWCGICRKEMPEMQAAAAKLGRAARFALVQVREPIKDARGWMKRQGIHLPLFDSGARSADDGDLRLAGGGTLQDRMLAKAFPSTYILDRHGIVLFLHTGALHDWSEYVSFIQHAASGNR